MKAVIFAGGVGTRLWPLSRKKSPKQFEKILGDKSTLQLSVERLLPDFAPEDIYIATGKQYLEILFNQLDYIPKENIVGEPVRKDVGPAVAVMMGFLSKKFPNEPVIILWSDHLVQNIQKFKEILKSADEYIRKDPNKIIFIGQKPRFPSVNLGWIETGEIKEDVNGVKIKEFLGFKYRPNEDLANKYFKDQKYCWNLGYFVSTPGFVFKLFERFAPKIYDTVNKMIEAETAEDFFTRLNKYYEEMPEISFDNAVAEQLDKNFAAAVIEDIGWSDVGAWEALKEALEVSREENITKGRVLLEDSIDNLVYNYQNDKMVVGIDLNELLVVNTDDVLLVANKNSVSKIKKLVESFQGTEFEELT